MPFRVISQTGYTESVRLLIICFLIFGGLTPAYAEIYLIVNERLDAFESPSEKSRIKRRLVSGEKFLHTGKRGRGFIEILDEDGVKLYVLRDDMYNSELKKEIPKTLHNTTQFGFDIYYSTQLQSERELQTSVDTFYDVSEFTGSSFFFGGYFSLLLHKEWVGRLSVRMRKTEMEGASRLQGSMLGGSSTFLLTQDFVSLGVGLSRTFLKPNLYLLGEVEFAQGTAVELKVIDGTPVDTSGLEKPFFVIFSGALGYHKKLSSKWILSPEFRVGFVSTADPFIMLIEGRAGVAYLW